MSIIRPIRSEKDYNEALVAASRFFDNVPEPGTIRSRRLIPLKRSSFGWNKHNCLCRI